MIQFIHKHAFALQLFTLIAIIFLFGINFNQEAMPRYMLFYLSLPLAILSLLCFYEFTDRSLRSWRKINDFERVFNIVKFIVSVFSVFLNVTCANTWSNFM